MQGQLIRWLSTEEIGQRLGMTAEWVRRQVLAGRLRARVYRTGKRATYRIREADYQQFVHDWSVSSDRPEWEDFLAGVPVEPRIPRSASRIVP